MRGLGQQPFSSALRGALALLVPRREPNEIIVVHHYTDEKGYLQLEVERRSDALGITFTRERL